MIKKTFIVLGLIYLVQFAISCIPCDCPGAETFEIDYYDLKVQAYNTAGFHDDIVEDTIYKNALGLIVTVEFDLINIAQLNSTEPSFCFNYGALWACSCVEDEFQYPDPIDRMEVFVSNVQTLETVEVTSSFSIYEYSKEELISLEEFFNNRENWHDGFQFELTEFDLIPNSAIFTVDTYLKSGVKFTKKTEQINFYLKKSLSK